MAFIEINALPSGERLPGWKDRTFSSRNMTFAHFAFTAGAKIHEHCHSNEEVWTVIEGELEVTIGGDSIVAKPGLVAIVPPFSAHSVRAITDGKAIVTDSPVRTDTGGGRRGVVAVDFDTAVALPDSPGNAVQIPFTLRNWGKTRVVAKELKVEAGVAPALPPAAMTEFPTGELRDYCALEPDERRIETIPAQALTRDDVASVRNGASVFYVRGIVFYEDGFGSIQHRTFCSVYDRDALDGRGGFVTPSKPGYNYGS